MSYCAEAGICISGRIEVAASVGRSAGIVARTGRLAGHVRFAEATSALRHSTRLGTGHHLSNVPKGGARDSSPAKDGLPKQCRNSLLRRKYDETFALWIIFLLERHAILGPEPPIYLRSMTATRLPSPANVHAATVEPVAAPENHQIKFFRLRLLQNLGGWRRSALFMRLFLSERQVHSWLALISPGQPLTLPRATVHSRLLGQYALSTVE